MKRALAITAMLFVWGTTSCFKKVPPNEFALLHQRACIESLELKDHVRAQTHCELCLEYEASMPECLNGIGLIALANNDEEKAKTFFSKALRQNGDFSQARNNLGVIYFMEGDFGESLKYFDRALEIDPSNVDARYNAGLSHFRIAQRLRASPEHAKTKQHLLSAKDQLRKLVAIEPTYHVAFRDLGLIDLNLYELSEFEHAKREFLTSAKASFQLCLEGDVEEDGCYEGLAQIYFEEGHYDQSFANYFLCLSFAPNNAACRSAIVVSYEKAAHTEEGYRHFKKAVSNAPANALAHEAFCASLFERGLDEQAVKECQVAVRLKPDLCSAHFRLAEYYAQVLNVDGAVKHCKTFLTCGTNGGSRETKKCTDILITVQR